MRRLGFALVWFLLSAAVVPAQGSAYSTFLGAAGQDEDGELGRVNAIAVDRDGSAYVAGLTRNSGFPTTPGAFNRTYAGPSAFVTKFTPDGSALEYSTLLARGSQVEDIAVDAQGNAYVTGTTGSASFPTTANAYDRSLSGPSDVFVAKLDATGSHLLYSSYLGGADEGGEFAPSIAVGPGGDAYVVGTTGSTDFPTTAGAYQRTRGGGDTDAFVARLSTSASQLVYSTLLGGLSYDQATGVAVDSAGRAYAGGLSASDDFPSTSPALDPGPGTDVNAFVARVAADGSSLGYSARFGGPTADVRDVTVDEQGSAYATGAAWSPSFPTTSGAYDTTHGTADDAFVVKLSPDGSAFQFSTLLGGDGFDEGRAIALDGLHRPVVVRNAEGAQFITRLNATGSALSFSGALAGSARDLALDPAGNAYVTGQAFDESFPTTPGAFDTHFDYADSYVTTLAIGVGPPATLVLSPKSATNTLDEGGHCVTASVADAAGDPTPEVSVDFEVTGATTASGSASTDVGGDARFCYQGPDFPGTDTITAAAGKPGPHDSATKTWVAPAATDGCKVNANGRIQTRSDDDAAFTINVHASSKGRITYLDGGPADHLTLRSSAIESVVCGGRHATIYGSSFRVELYDRGNPGRRDTFRVLAATGYDSGTQTLDAGNIKVRG